MDRIWRDGSRRGWGAGGQAAQTGQGLLDLGAKVLDFEGAGAQVSGNGQPGLGGALTDLRAFRLAEADGDAGGLQGAGGGSGLGSLWGGMRGMVLGWVNGRRRDFWEGPRTLIAEGGHVLLEAFIVPSVVSGLSGGQGREQFRET